jgi:hypothetical protein
MHLLVMLMAASSPLLVQATQLPTPSRTAVTAVDSHLAKHGKTKPAEASAKKTVANARIQVAAVDHAHALHTPLPPVAPRGKTAKTRRPAP